MYECRDVRGLARLVNYDKIHLNGLQRTRGGIVSKTNFKIGRRASNNARTQICKVKLRWTAGIVKGKWIYASVLADQRRGLLFDNPNPTEACDLVC